jgi:hypothetical protein
VMSLYEEKIKIPANTSKTGLKFVIASYPATIMSARITTAPVFVQEKVSIPGTCVSLDSG